MFASMFKSFLKKSETKHKEDEKKAESEIVEFTTQDVEDMLTELDELKDNSNDDSNCSTSKDIIDIIEDIDLLSITGTYSDISNNNDLVDHFDDTKSKGSFEGENKQESTKVCEDQAMIKIVNQINNLQCPFTWHINTNKNKDVISSIQKRYGDYNLNISSSEFTFKRFLGNLIISYELFQKGDIDTAQLKVLEIGKWLEELDSGTDEFYLSINIGLKHIMQATFIHMLFAINLIGEVEWLIAGINSFCNMDTQSKAAVYAVRAATLTQFGVNGKILKKACEFAQKACVIDPITPYWFYNYSLALNAERHYLHTFRSYPTENEINAIQQAIMLSDGNNTSFNYHRMELDKDTIIRDFHTNSNKNDKVMIEKNYQRNKKIVQMIKTIVSMEPKDPLIIVNCARTLMTLPVVVRDINLGKQYLTKAFQMAPNDVTILGAIEKTIKHYKELSRNSKHRTTYSKQNQTPLTNKTSKLQEDLGLMVKKHKNGEDPTPYLIALVAKYNGLDKWKIMAQVCSYTILFKKNLRAGVEQFISLIEQPEMVADYLITEHYSTFSSKKFNLAELICNEIRLATNSSNVPSEDMLFYYKMLTKIMETYNVKVKEVDSSMKEKLIFDLPVKSTNTTYQSETDLSDDNDSSKGKPKCHRPKNLQNSGPKMFTKKPEFNTRARNIDSNSNNGSSIITENQSYWTKNTSSIDQMKLKMSKFSTTFNDGLRFPNNPNPPLNLGNLRNLQTQSEIDHYTHELYQHIGVSDGQLQNNSQKVSFDGFNDLNGYGNQNHSNMNSSFQHSPSKNSNIPSLLSLRPTWQPPNNYYPNKK